MFKNAPTIVCTGRTPSRPCTCRSTACRAQTHCRTCGMIPAPPPAAAVHRIACHSASRWRTDCCCVTQHSRSSHRCPRMSRRPPASGRIDCPHGIASVSRRALKICTLICILLNYWIEETYAYTFGTSARRLFRPMTEDRCWPKWPLPACRRSSELSDTRMTSFWRNNWNYE